MWEEIAEGFRREFSDLPEFTSLTQLLLRLLFACLLGGLIGYERETQGKSAGLRTHMLVCLGTTFAIAIPQQAGMDFRDLARIIQGIMAGVGLIGAGAILKSEDKGQVQGVTTAASTWFAAAIGISIGMGRESSAILGTLIVLGVLALIPQLTAKRGQS